MFYLVIEVVVYYINCNYEKVVEVVKEILEFDVSYVVVNLIIVFIYMENGRIDEV